MFSGLPSWSIVIHSWVGVQLSIGVFICLSCLLSGYRASGSQPKSAKSSSMCIGVFSNWFTGWGVIHALHLGGIITGSVVNFLVWLRPGSSIIIYASVLSASHWFRAR